MARSKSIPAAAMFVAIMNLILFLPCACCSGIGLVAGPAIGDGTAFAVDPEQKKAVEALNKRLKEKVPNLDTIQLLTGALTLAASLDLVVAAIGLLMRQNWGRILCIGGAILLIVVTLFNVGFQATKVIPVTLEAQKEVMGQQGQAAPGAADALGAIAYGALAINVVIQVGYSLLALILMLLPSVREFYTGSGSVADEADEGWSDSPARFDEDDRWRDTDR